jgi:hypothetical protein
MERFQVPYLKKKITNLLERSMKTTHNHTRDSRFSVKQGKFHIMKEDLKPIYHKLNTFFLPSHTKQEILSRWARDTVIKVSAC